MIENQQEAQEQQQEEIEVQIQDDVQAESGEQVSPEQELDNYTTATVLYNDIEAGVHKITQGEFNATHS